MKEVWILVEKVIIHDGKLCDSGCPHDTQTPECTLSYPGLVRRRRTCGRSRYKRTCECLAAKPCPRRAKR